MTSQACSEKAPGRAHRGAGPSGGGAELPDPVELRAWRSFLRAHAVVTRRLEAELLAAHELPLGTYDVLVQLTEAPEGRLRMSELAEAVLLSRSGLTRLVDRMERDGLVQRQSCPSDARGTFTVVTPEGRRRLREAAPTHLRGVRTHVTGRLTQGELTELTRMLDHVAGPDQVTPAGRSCGGASVAGPPQVGG